eukprot:457600-Rhodomonas_salina.1
MSQTYMMRCVVAERMKHSEVLRAASNQKRKVLLQMRQSSASVSEDARCCAPDTGGYGIVGWRNPSQN